MDESNNKPLPKNSFDEQKSTDSYDVLSNSDRNEISSAPEVDVVPSDEQNRLHASLVVSASDIKTEDDLDLNAPPTEFKSNEEDEPPKEEDLKRAINSIMNDNAKPQEASEPIVPKSLPIVMKASLREKLKQAFYAWWDNRLLRYGTIGAVLAVLCIILFVPIVRTSILNLVGVRSTLTVIAIDETTLMPLKNVVLRAGSTQIKTDDKGYAKLYDIRLGKQIVTVSKPGFKEFKKTIVFGLRTENLGDVTLKAQGILFSLQITDYLSGKPIKDVEVMSGEATTVSDKKGKAILTVPPMNDSEKVEIKITQKGYRSETITLPADFSGVKEVEMVVGQRAIFINKESGKFDVYKMYVDGAKKELLLAGTGLETASIKILPDPAGKYAALVSTRDDKRNSDGYLLTTLTLINIENGDTDTIERAEQIDLLGWRGTTLIYSHMVAGVSAANPNRQKIIAYNYESAKRNLLASANYFNNSILGGDTLYYIVSATDPSAKPGFMKVEIDGSSKKMIYEGDVWSLIQTDYQTFKLQMPSKWYDYKLGTAAAVSANPSTSYLSKQFTNSPDGKRSVWVDQRDSSGVLMQYDIATDKDTEIAKERGLSEVAYWLGQRVVVYRTYVNGEMHEYAVSIDGGDAKHISEVSYTYQS